MNLEDYDLLFKDGFYIDEEDKINCSYADLRWTFSVPGATTAKSLTTLRTMFFPSSKNYMATK